MGPGTSLQRIFKTLADSTRLRLLAALSEGELAVQELTDALGVPQPRVSRHLGILREAGWVRDRREGSFVFYHFTLPRAAGAVWAAARQALESDPLAGRDREGLARVLEARRSRSHSFFDSVGPEWDALRKVLNDDLLRARALTRLISSDITVVDVGTGTGVLAAELSALGLRVVAVDNSRRMLEAARSKLSPEALANVELRHGEASALPLDNDEVGAAFAHMVLHYLPSPEAALREMVRVTQPGGTVVVVDFIAHEREWMRDELGVLWLGFEPDNLRSWLLEAGLHDVRVEQLAPLAKTRELPQTIIASGRVPGKRNTGRSF
jgi:ArsR family transcriptional regulator